MSRSIFAPARIALIAILSVVCCLLRPAAAQSPQWACSFNIPTVSSTIPSDALVGSQRNLTASLGRNSFALNWAAAPDQRGVANSNSIPAMFGSPNATAPTVWETYKDRLEVFLPAGAKPQAWNAPPPTHSCPPGTADATLALLRQPGVRVLSMLSAFGDLELDATTQASGQWLADRNNNLIYYEVRIIKPSSTSSLITAFMMLLCRT